MYEIDVMCFVWVYLCVIAYLLLFQVVELNRNSHFCYCRSWMFKLRCHCFICLFVCSQGRKRNFSEEAKLFFLIFSRREMR